MACDNICVINGVGTGTNPVAFKEAKIYKMLILQFRVSRGTEVLMN